MLDESTVNQYAFQWRYIVATRTIVVTNDDADYLEMIKAILEEEGYERVVCMVRPGLEEVAHEQPMLILIDVHLGSETKAWALLDRIKLHRGLQDVPGIICSTDPRLLQAKAAWLLRQGYTTLEKPFRIEDLLAAVAARIGPPRGSVAA